MAAKLLSGRQAAKILKVSHQTVYNWIEQGRLIPSYTSTTGPLFDEEYVQLLAKQQERDRAEIVQPVA